MIPKCCYSFILATTMLAASLAQGATFDFESGSGAGTSTFTTTAGGVTATFVATGDTWRNEFGISASNISGKSLFSNASTGMTAVAVSFSSPIDIATLVISDYVCTFNDSASDYIQFSVTDGSGNSTVQETQLLGGDTIGIITTLNWTNITAFQITKNGGNCGATFTPIIDTINFTTTNNAPTDIALDSTSINQSATGSGAVVGNLTTTDADGDPQTYSLVTNLSSGYGNCGAAGDDNNASFQIDNTNDHLETASALSPGSYSVCIQTHDGTDSYQESFSITVADNVGPTVSSVSVPANGTYITGNNLDFTVNLNENTTVNTTGGTPSLALTIGATAKSASYLSGSGTAALVFRYTIESGLVDSDGIVLGSAVSLNGGTLQDSSGNNITTTLNPVGSLTSVLVDSTAPTVSSVTVPANATYVAGQNLDFTVNTSENVTVNTGGGTPSLSLTIGATGKSANYISGSGTSALVFRYTIESGLADSDGISLGGAVGLGGGTIKDSAGNDLTTTLNSVGSLTSVLVDATAPTVSSVSVPANATYVAGQNLDFTVNTSENVTVNTGGGTPSLSLTIGATGKSANYISGSGTSALVFRYTIESGLADSDGISLGGAVSLGGGTIKDSAGNDLTTTLNSVGSLTSVLVDATAPTVSSVSVPANATYVAGQNLDFTVNTSENVTVNTSGGTPTLAVTIGATGKTASYLSGSGSSAIVFRYTVEAGLTDSDGISLGSSISLNSGTIQDAAGNDLATTLNAVGSLASVLVDSTAPTVSSVSVPANGTYIAGTNLDFTVNTSENITVNTGGGTPSLALTIGATAKTASYVSGSGSSALVFRYTLESGLSDTDGIALGSAISTGGGTLKDSAGNDLTTTLNSVASLTAVLVDAIAPTVSSVSVPANATYIAGQNLDFTVNTTENVTVNTTSGTPTLDLTIGATGKSASYVSGSGTTALVFRYTIESGLADSDGIALGGAISLNSGTLQDAAGNNLTTTLNSVGSLTAVLVDATAPTVSSVSVPANATYVAGNNLDFTVNTSENVTVNTTGGAPTLAITIGATGKTATYISGTGTSALLFRYTVEAGLQDSDGIALAGSINLNSGTIKDNAGNDLTTTLNSVGSLTSVLVDAIVPTVTISGSSVNNSAFTATFTFSEAVTGFTIGDIVASNASLGSFSATSSSVYTVLVTPTSDGAVTLDVAANVATDTAGNNNTAASQFSATYDGTAPTVTITTTSDPVNAAFTATFTFSEAVTGFAIGDISAGNASLGGFSATSASVYTVTVTPTSDGAVTLDVAANVAADAAGNNNTAASQLSVTYDGTAPAVAITSGASIYNAAFTATVTFSEGVAGFAIGDISAGNANLSSFNATSSSVYTVLVTPSSEGTVTLDVASNGATDTAGNGNTAASQLSVNFDTTAPTVAITSTASAYNSAFTATFTFSEAVTGFTIGDIVASNASLGSFSATSSSVYTVLVTPTSDGAVTLDVAANVVTDTAGNNNTAASQFSATYDATAPTVTITTTSDPVNNAFTATVTFSEDVTGFTIGDISTGNASLGGFSATSASVYTVTVTPTSDGAVTLDVAANVAADAAGNNNTAATQLSVTYDGTAPTVAITSGASIYNAPFTATITFSEDVTGFAVGDISAGNANLSSFNATSASVYTVLVTPTSDGAVTLDIAANVAADSAGNNNTAATQLSINYDATAPTVALSSTATDVNAAFTATITFSEDVTGFVVGDIAAGNASLSSFSATSASVYTVLVTPTTDGAVTLDLAANVAADAAGNNNTAATQLSVTYDATAPTVTITTASDPVNAAFTTTITFSEDVTGFAIGDIVAGNASLSSFSATSASVYTVTVTPTSDGTVTLDVAANVAADAVGNNNTAASQLSVIYDGTAPTVAITSSASLYNAPFTATITFNEDVTGFAVGDISAGNASLSSFNATSASVYTVLVTPTSDGAVTLDIAANVAADSAGNNNTAATQLSVTYDATAPTVALSATATDVNAAFTATITFSEDVTGFVVGDIAASNASLGSFSATSASVYTVLVTPTTDGAVTLDVAANVAADAAGNNNTAATQLSVTYDATAPTVTITSASDPVNAAFTATITFSEAVTGFAIGDIVAGNASLGGFSATSASVYTVTVTPTSDGAVTLDVAANVALDTAGNNNTAATQLSVAYDGTAPTVAITGGASLVNTAFTATITFSEAVTGFAVGDIAAGNASLSNFNATSTTVYTVLVTPAGDGTVTLDIAADIALDGAGNGNTAATQFSVIYDTAAPTLASSTPAAGSVDIDRNTDITLTFSEAVSAGSGNHTLALYDAADDSLVASTTADNAAVVITGSNAVWTTGVTLTPSHSYYLQVGAGSFFDVANNFYAGISDKTSLTFTVLNAAPVANADSQTTAEDNAVAVDVLANDTDSDSSLNAASTTVTVAPTNGSTSVNTADGVITYTPNANFNGSDSFTYTVSDVYGKVSNGGLVTLTVTSVNDTPVAVNDMATTPEDNAVSIAVAANDTDVDTGDSADSTTLVVVSQPSNGTAVVTAGEIVYTPNANFNGTDSFTYTIDDQNGGTSNAATVMVNVTGVNDLPVAVNDSTSTNEDNAVAIDVLANDSDIDGTLDATTVMVMTNPQSGSVSIDAITGEITYTPNGDFNGGDSFTYVVQDDAGGTSSPATVTITVNSVNDAPVASNDTAVLMEDTPHIINVVGNDSDVDGTLDTNSLVIVTAATSGSTIVNANGTMTYTPSANFNGSDSFTYTVNDNDGATSNTATVTITVTAVNDEPVANDDSATTNEDAAIVIDLAANDSDVDGTIDGTSFTLVTAPTLGTVASNDDGTVTYTPTANANGSDSFTYTFDDNQGASSNTATVSITVTAVNDAPTITGTPATIVAEDSSYSFTPSASDIDSTTLTFSQTGMPAWASFDTTTGTLSGTPANDDVGTSSSIVITVSDGNLTADLAAFTITVTNTNDAPVISGTPAGQVDEDGSYTFTPTGSDVDSGDNLTYTAANLPSWASIDPNTGAITGTPTNDDVGIYRDIVVTVDDGTTTTSLPAFSLTVANTNDAPVAAADSYTLAEGGILQATAETGVIANDVDVDAGDQLTATLVTGPTRAGNFTLNSDGSFSYRHNGGESRSDSFTYALSDGTVTLPATTVNLSITAVNDAPSFTSTPTQTGVTQGNRFSYTPITQDPDSVVDVEYTSGPSWLAFDGITLSGQVPFDAAPGNVAVTLTASDQAFDITQTFNLTVLERDTTLVTITSNWQGLPALVDEPLTLTATLTHSAGPAVTEGELLITIQGQDVSITAAGCEALSVSATSSQYTCPYALATGASTSQALTLSRASEGNIIVNFSARDTLIQSEVGAAITDVSVTDIAVGQGNTIFNLADATSLASIDLDGEGSRELVAGTSLGGEVQLLKYDLGNRTAEVTGTIANTGNTRQVKVGDINGDGLEDVVVVNDSGDASNVYYQSGANSFEPEPSTQALPYASRALLIDLDNDDLPEMILGGRGNRLYIYPNVDGIYSATPLIFSSPVEIVHFALFNRAPGSEPYTGKFAISTQGAVKLVRFSVSAAGNQKPQLGTQRKAGSEANSEQVLVFEELDSMDIAGVTELISQDLDNDGEQELIVSTTHTNNSAEQSGVSITKITGDTLQPVATLGNASAKDVKLADFNGDGVTDLLVANDNDSYQFYLGDGTATGWALKDTIIFSPSTLVLPEDVNGDGLADVIVYEDSADEVDLYLSDFDGNLGQTANLSLTASASAISNTRYQWQYVLTLTNPAAESINDVTLTATLPAGITVAAKPAVCTVAGTSITCSLTSLAVGSEAFAFTLTANAKPAGSASATVSSNALDNDLSNNSATTDFAPLFVATEVRVEGGGKSGGTVHPWMLFILAALLAIRFAPPLITRLAGKQALSHLQLLIIFKRFSSVMAQLMTHSLIKPACITLAATATLFTALYAKADDSMYLEANFGKASSHWNASGLTATMNASAQQMTVSDLDDERGTQEVLLGYRFIPLLAVELGYRDWGEISYALEGIASNSAAVISATQAHYPASGKGAFVGLRASYWHGDNLEGYAKLSAWDWSGDYTTYINNQPYSFEAGDTDVVVSVGMNGYFFERYSAGVVYQTTRLDGQRNVMVGLSLGLRF